MATNLELKHTMNCAGLIPGEDDDCTCGLRYRIELQTEQTMHAAWRKRAEESERERDELLAIVRKLPVTADGVPITPGMSLYFAVEDQVLTALHRSGGIEYSGNVGVGIPFPFNSSGWFSTRAAALSAASAPAAGGKE